MPSKKKPTGLIDEWELPVCAECHKGRMMVSRGEWCSVCQKTTKTEAITVVRKRGKKEETVNLRLKAVGFEFSQEDLDKMAKLPGIKVTGVKKGE